jgi:hypothetical protein
MYRSANLGRLRGFVGQRRPKFPYGLGCSSCRKGLGQDDVVDEPSWQGGGSYGIDANTGLSLTAGPQSPTYTVLGPVSNATLNSEVYGTGPIAGGSNVAQVPSGSALSFSLPSVNSPTVVTAAPSTLSSYLPLILLGLGGVVVIAAVKKR